MTPDAYPDKRYDAAVVKLYPQVNRQKGTLKVEVRLLEPDDALLPDMSVRITFLPPPDAPGRRRAVRAGPGRRGAPRPPPATPRSGWCATVWQQPPRRARRRRRPVRIASGLAGRRDGVVGDVALAEGQRVVADAS